MAFQGMAQSGSLKKAAGAMYSVTGVLDAPSVGDVTVNQAVSIGPQ